MAGVELFTQRLFLRQPTADDLDTSHALTAGADMRTFLGRDPPSLEDSFNRLLRNAGSWALYGYGTFIVVERASGRHVGGCGLFRTHRGLGEDFDGHPEAGWVIAHDCWGKGYATEAMTTVLGWFDKSHGGRSVCMIVPGNTASEQIAAKLGYEATRLAQYKTEGVMLYARNPA